MWEFERSGWGIGVSGGGGEGARRGFFEGKVREFEKSGWGIGVSGGGREGVGRGSGEGSDRGVFLPRIKGNL